MHPRSLFGAIAIALVCLPSDASAQCALVDKILASDGATSDHYGHSVSLYEDRVAAGAHVDDAGAGSAYILDDGPTGFTESAKVIAVDRAPDDQFGWSVSLTLDRVIVGAPGNDDAGSESGSAYIFDLVNGTWTLVAKLVASDAAAGDRFGSSVAIVGDFAAVGAESDNHGGLANAGSVYVFRKLGATWGQVAKLTNSDAQAGDELGSSVAIADNGAIIAGAPRKSTPFQNSGAAYVFELIGSSFIQTAKLQGTPVTQGEFVGIDVDIDIDGGRVVVGGIGNDALGGVNNGAAYVFEKSGPFWLLDGKLVPNQPNPADQFGLVAAIDGDRVAVGAMRDDIAGQDTGSVYVFERIGGIWTQVSYRTAPDAAALDAFGSAIELDESRLVIGASSNDDLGQESGSIYVASNIDAIDAFGAGCPGTGGFVPRLYVAGCPTAGAPITVGVDKGLGGTTAFLFLGLNGINQPLPGGCVLYMQPLPTVLILPLGGALPGDGSASFNAPLPATTPAGVVIYLQAFLLDNGVPTGFSGTNAFRIETQ